MGRFLAVCVLALLAAGVGEILWRRFGPSGAGNAVARYAEENGLDRFLSPSDIPADDARSRWREGLPGAAYDLLVGAYAGQPACTGLLRLVEVDSLMGAERPTGWGESDAEAGSRAGADFRFVALGLAEAGPTLALLPLPAAVDHIPMRRHPTGDREFDERWLAIGFGAFMLTRRLRTALMAEPLRGACLRLQGATLLAWNLDPDGLADVSRAFEALHDLASALPSEMAAGAPGALSELPWQSRPTIKPLKADRQGEDAESQPVEARLASASDSPAPAWRAPVIRPRGSRDYRLSALGTIAGLVGAISPGFTLAPLSAIALAVLAWMGWRAREDRGSTGWLQLGVGAALGFVIGFALRMASH